MVDRELAIKFGLDPCSGFCHSHGSNYLKCFNSQRISQCTALRDCQEHIKAECGPRFDPKDTKSEIYNTVLQDELGLNQNGGNTERTTPVCPKSSKQSRVSVKMPWLPCTSKFRISFPWSRRSCLGRCSKPFWALSVYCDGSEALCTILRYFMYDCDALCTKAMLYVW